MPATTVRLVHAMNSLWLVVVALSYLVSLALVCSCGSLRSGRRPAPGGVETRIRSQVTLTSIGVGAKPAAGLCCCGQFDSTTTTGISARSVT